MVDSSRDLDGSNEQASNQWELESQLSGEAAPQAQYGAGQLQARAAREVVDRGMDQGSSAPGVNASSQAQIPGSDMHTAVDDKAGTEQRLQEMLAIQVADILNQSLADCVDLQVQCQQARWNTMAAGLQTLSSLFGEIGRAVAEHAQLLAERIIAVGGVAHGTLAAIAERSGLNEYPALPDGWQVDVHSVMSALDIISDALDDETDLLDEISDAESAELMAAIGRTAEHYIGCLSCHGV